MQSSKCSIYDSLYQNEWKRYGGALVKNVREIDATPHPCPYLEGEIATLPLRFYEAGVDKEHLDELLALSDRRVGRLMYRPSCGACRACEAIRIPVREFKLSKSERRTFKRNQDIAITIGPAIVDEERITLFNRHKLERGLADEPITNEHYANWLVHSCTLTAEIRYHLDDRLVGLSVVDIGKSSVSSVYFYFDPDLSDRRLGVFSVLAEASWVRSQGMEFYYLGLYIEACSHMNYKANFLPHERLIDGEWRRFAT